MKLIIAGSRTITDYAILWRGLDAMARNGFDSGEVMEVVSGGARGADKLGERWAGDWEIPVKRFLPDWSKGKTAGMIRNCAMVDYVMPDGALVVLWDGVSKGAAQIADYGRKRGLRVHVERTD
jgi:hypothetical protein